MSWPLVRAVYAYTPDLDAPAKAVLLALAFHANREGVAWPSVRVLQSDTGLRERSVRAALVKLTVHRHLEIVPSPGRASMYLLTPAPGAGPTPAPHADTPACGAPTPAPRAGGRRTGKELVKNSAANGSRLRAPAALTTGPVVPGPFSTSTGPTWTELPDGTVTRARP